MDAAESCGAGRRRHGISLGGAIAVASRAVKRRLAQDQVRASPFLDGAGRARAVGIRGACASGVGPTGAAAEMIQPQHAVVPAVIDVEAVRTHRAINEDPSWVEQPAAGDLVGHDLGEGRLAKDDIGPAIPRDPAHRNARRHRHDSRLVDAAIGSLDGHLGGNCDRAGLRDENALRDGPRRDPGPLDIDDGWVRCSSKSRTPRAGRRHRKRP